MVAPLDADPFDIETLRTCNPAAGIYLNESDLVAKAEMAASTLAFEPGFRRFRLNQRVRTDADARMWTPRHGTAAPFPSMRPPSSGRRA